MSGLMILFSMVALAGLLLEGIAILRVNRPGGGVECMVVGAIFAIGGAMALSVLVNT